MTYTLVVCNQKGGVGKTTTAVNVAASLAAAEQSTLLVDMDPQGNAGSGVGINKSEVEQSIYHVLIGEAKIQDVLKKTDFSHLSLCPANLDLVGAEVELGNHFSRGNRLQQAIRALQGHFKYVVVDCPPSLGLLTVNALTAADGVLTPVQCEYYALEGVADLMNTIELIRENCNPQLELLGVLPTMFDARNNLARQVEQEIRNHFGDKVFQAVIPRNVRLSEAPSHGKPILMYDIRSIGAVRYLELAQEIMARVAVWRDTHANDTTEARVGQGAGLADSDETRITDPAAGCAPCGVAGVGENAARTTAAG